MKKKKHLSARVMVRTVLLRLKSGQLIASQIWELCYSYDYTFYHISNDIKLNKNHRSITLVCRSTNATFLLLSQAASHTVVYSTQEVVQRWLTPSVFSNSNKTRSSLIQNDNTIQMLRSNLMVSEPSELNIVYAVVQCTGHHMGKSVTCNNSLKRCLQKECCNKKFTSHWLFSVQPHLSYTCSINTMIRFDESLTIYSDNYPTTNRQ